MSASSTRTFGLMLLFGNKYADWVFDNDMLPLITPHYISEKIAELAKEIFPNTIGLWDMFGGIGGDTISFGKYFKIFATELNENNYQLLKKNCETFNNSIIIKNADCIEYLEEQPIDIDLVYFDPPWGDSFKTGKFFDFNNIKLSNGLNVVELLLNLLPKYNIIIKSPIDSDTFENMLQDYQYNLFIFKKHKLKFIFIPCVKTPKTIL